MAGDSAGTMPALSSCCQHEESEMFKTIFITRLGMFLMTALLAWGIGPTETRAQSSCPHGASGGSPAGGHAGHQSAPPSVSRPSIPPVSQPTSGGGSPIHFGSTGAEPERPEVANDVIEWPKLLQDRVFASSRRQIEAPYRRSPPDLSAPTASDYRNMVKTAEEMKSILQWVAKKGVDTEDYRQAEGFLAKLGIEARKRSEVAGRATPSLATQPSPPKAMASLQPTWQAPSSNQTDLELIEKQKNCPVTDEPLGATAKPVKMVVKERTVFLCCADCKSRLLADPDKYLKKLDEKK